MHIEVLTPPAVDPVSLQEAKEYCRVETSAEDALITGLIKAARKQVEIDTGRALAPQTLRVTFDGFPRRNTMPLPRPPLVSVEKVEYMDRVGAAAELVVDDDVFVTNGLFGGVRVPSRWPLALRAPGSVRVTYVAGHGAVDGDEEPITEPCPEQYKLAMLMLVSHWYDTRTPVVVGTSVLKVDQSYERLVSGPIRFRVPD